MCTRNDDYINHLHTEPQPEPNHPDFSTPPHEKKEYGAQTEPEELFDDQHITLGAPEEEKFEMKGDSTKGEVDSVTHEYECGSLRLRPPRKKRWVTMDKGIKPKPSLIRPVEINSVQELLDALQIVSE